MTIQYVAMHLHAYEATPYPFPLDDRLSGEIDKAALAELLGIDWDEEDGEQLIILELDLTESIPLTRDQLE